MKWAIRSGAVLTVGLLCSACPGSTAKGPDKGPPTSASTEAIESIYEGHLQAGWESSGTAPQESTAGGPVKVRFPGSAEWRLTQKGASGNFSALFFRVKEPLGEGEFLEVRLGTGDGGAYPAIKLKPDHRTEVGDGWILVRIPMDELNPSGMPFDSVVFRSFRPTDAQWVLLDNVALVKSAIGSGRVGQAATVKNSSVVSPSAAKAAVAAIACDAAATPISPFIYGTAAGDKGWPDLKAPARRWGGNLTSRYNWEGPFQNSAGDWFFENHAGGSYAEFLKDGADHGSPTALTIPTLGWVAKDAGSYSFPVSVFGPQAKADPWHSDAGNGVALNGKLITPGPPTRTSVTTSPEWAKRWVSTIVANAAKSGRREVYEYILDNEPMLWHATHRDVHPDPVGYDELLDRTIQYGSAIRQADPDALIAGPAEWGWSAYFDSSKDLAQGGFHADRRAHDNLPLVEWYLRKLREQEEKTHTRLLDVLDLHYYPQGANVFAGGGGVDRATQLLRLRSTRSLWDPSYVDESWIHDVVRLLPRMKEWVAKNYPGRGISIGEWNFGAEQDITGALATAEALGRFAQFGVTSAFYWVSPPQGSASSFAFLAFRNFDKKGGHFLDWFVPSTSPDGVSLFASRDAERKHLVLVAINMTPDAPRLAQLDLRTCGTIASSQAFVYGQGAAAFVASPPVKGEGASLEQTLSPWSITVIDLHLN
jgi:hypothetical protein